MKSILLPLLLLVQTSTPVGEAGNPVAGMHRFALDVIYWQGSFGTYLVPDAGSQVRLDLAAIGTNELLSSSLTDREGHKVTWRLGYLKVTEDETKREERGWTRRVVLKGPAGGNSKSSARTILELRIQYEVEYYKEQDGRRVKQCGNNTHYVLTMHTLEADDTIRDFAKASRSFNRDQK